MPQKLTTVALIGVLMLLISPNASRAQIGALDQPMQFFIASAGNSVEATWIAAVGTIDRETPERFLRFLEVEGDGDAGKIVFDSPGGNLVAALQLGRAIRGRNLATAIGRTVMDPRIARLETMARGQCQSACAYAFLGGSRRDLYLPWAEEARESRIGFHQYSNDTSIAGNLTPAIAAELQSLALSQAQFTAGLIASYLTEMGVDARILELAARAAPNEIVYPTEAELLSLRVLTDSRFQAWQLEPFNSGVIAVSSEDNPLSLAERFSAFCILPDRSPVLMITSQWFDVNGKPSIAPLAPQDALQPSEYGMDLWLDEQPLELPASRVAQVFSQGYLFYVVRIDRSLVSRLETTSVLQAQVAAPRVAGVHSARSVLTDKDRRSIALAFRNCI